MKCNHCGTEFEAKFCPECGARADFGSTHPEQQVPQPNYQTGAKPKKKKKTVVIVLLLILIVIISAVAVIGKSEITNTPEEIISNISEEVNSSPDKYTWYIKNYSGKNCASIGYTAMSGKRMDRYGEGLVELIFVTADGSYVDVENEDELQKFSVVKQNIAPNTEMKLVFEKDSDGNEYDSLVASQSFEEIVLSVKRVGTMKKDEKELTSIKPSPDKYTWYIADYVGRNLANCGYTSMGGDLMHKYGEGIVELIIVADDGSFVDPTDTDSLKNYVVTGQSVSPNTELKLVFDKDSDGKEYDSLVDTQNIEEIELYVTKLSSQTTTTKATTTTETTTTTEPTTEKEDDLVDGMRPEFKAAMDSYETFMTDYVDFMKKFEEDPSDLSVLADYADYMSKYAEFVEDFEAWDEEEMNNAEMAYYIDVQARVSKKLLEIS